MATHIPTRIRINSDFTRANLIRVLEGRMDSFEHSVLEFKNRFEQDPGFAFKWGGDALAAATKRSVYRYVVASIQKDAESARALTPTRIREWAEGEVLRRAKYPPQSTSPMSNLCEQYEAAAWAEIQEILQHRPAQWEGEDAV